MTTINISSGDVYVRQNSGLFEYSSSSVFNTTTAITAWPISLNNTSGSNKNVFIVGNLELTIAFANMYFIMGGPNITINGQNNTVTVNGVSNYPGLVQNGTSSANGQNNIKINNLGVLTSNGATLAQFGGWIGQRYMNKSATGCVVNNCYSTGSIALFGGGIMGQESNGSATNCYSTGSISIWAGGIYGRNSNGSATNCFTTGSIDVNAGGIFGYFPSGTATNCYTTGLILGGGGISGSIFGGWTQQNSFAEGNGIWNDTNAATYLTGAPTYSSRILTAQGNTWFDIDLASYSTPWLLTSFIPPFTNFTLSPTSVNERALYSGTLTSDSTTTTQYSILSQPWDNMYISGNTLNARYGLSYRDYQYYPVQISGTSSGITIIRSFAIQIVNMPDAPIEVFLSNTKIPENSTVGSVVGTLQTYDLDPGNTFTYQLVSGVGSSDNSSFRIQNDVLYTATTFNYKTKSAYSIRVKSTDNTGLSVENPILLSVVLPTAVSFEISGVGNAFQIELKGQSVNGGALSFEIIRQPSFGSLEPSNTNGVFVYTSNNTTRDNFQYVVREGSMTSLPATVIVYKYNQSDVSNIPLNMGPVQFSSVSVVGTNWLFGGIISTNSFIQESPTTFRIGNMTFGTI